MAEQDVKFIVRGRFVNPEGKDLGPVEAEQPEEQPEEQDEEQGEGTDTRKVEELRDALEAAEVEIPSGSKKADLLKLAQQHGV